jgi:hypothetical protein
MVELVSTKTAGHGVAVGLLHACWQGLYSLCADNVSYRIETLPLGVGLERIEL